MGGNRLLSGKRPLRTKVAGGRRRRGEKGKGGVLEARQKASGPPTISLTALSGEPRAAALYKNGGRERYSSSKVNRVSVLPKGNGTN